MPRSIALRLLRRTLGVGGGYTKKTPWYQRFPTERGVPDRSDGYQKATKVHTCIMTTRPTVTRTLLKNALSDAATLSCIANDYGYDAVSSRQVETQAQCDICSSFSQQAGTRQM